ncbi:hypothetical protein DLNHIDIE_00557 [Acidithiobacillus thiooxidans ATCC 19377]|uniref:Uncharacterized protein n=1 Tax=Acidithiobacillus thiooxidans ATCC 19377 TaxID=637390 RepID=A0A543Q2Z4_ACITH|nr:hypothetical protein DLNHIDIE_00557 [Acidithiobacillus thiooxidans ATCC 19377]
MRVFGQKHPVWLRTGLVQIKNSHQNCAFSNMVFIFYRFDFINLNLINYYKLMFGILYAYMSVRFMGHGFQARFAANFNFYVG